MSPVAVLAALLLLVPLVWRRRPRRRLRWLQRDLSARSGSAGLAGADVPRWGSGSAGATAGGVVPPEAGAAGGARAGAVASGWSEVDGRRWQRIGTAVLAGASVAWLVGGWFGIPVGVAAAVGVERYLRRQEPPARRRERLAAVADLPLGADLLAAALRAGAPIDRAAAAVSEALVGPLGERLQRTARSLRLGAEPAEAWKHLAGIDGADRLVAAAVRSSASGGALAGALGRLADDLRADRVVAAEAAAQRAGVLIVLPLGLCFLPAFVLAGIVPVVIALVHDVF